jgi:hypothetical protein
VGLSGQTLVATAETTISSWTGPVVLTLCLSVLALLVSITALVWQVISWRRNGPRVRVASKWGFAGATPFISIEITNAGRMATEVNQLGFQLSEVDDRQHIAMVRDVLRMPVTLPIPLAPGATVSKMYAASDVLEVMQNFELTGTEARPYADTGHGRTEGDQCDLRARAERLVAAAEREV